MRKVFILDTNVILCDPQAIFRFPGNNVIIPITVLEELDKLKSHHLNARIFIRTLENTPQTNNQFQLPNSVLTIAFIPEHVEHTEHTEHLLDKSIADNKILSFLTKPEHILVSKDINMRLKAKALGFTAEDYAEIDRLYKGYRIISNLETDTIDLVYKKLMDIDLSTIITDPVPNEYFLLRNGKQTVTVRYNPLTELFDKVSEEVVAGIRSRNLEQLFALDALLNSSCQLITLTGIAGAGKTLLALAAAIHQRKSYTQILLARPLVSLANKEVGFLPGDINEKIDPYMQPLFDNLKVIKEVFNNNKVFDQLTEQKKIEIAPLPFIRGRSIPKTFFIIDEAQNLTPHEIKTIITRAGEDTKIIFTGDINQIDAHTNGLTYLIEKMRGQNVYAHVNLEKSERSYLAELAANLL